MCAHDDIKTDLDATKKDQVSSKNITNLHRHSVTVKQEIPS